MSIIRRRPFKVALDAALLTAFVVTFVTRERSFDPDFLVHSVTGLAIVAIVAVHLASNWGWITRVWVRRRGDRDARLGAFDALFGTTTAVCIIAGVPLWIGEVGGSLLTGLHTATGLLATLMMVTHLAWNQRRLRALIRPRTP